MRRFILLTLLLITCPCLSAYEYEKPTLEINTDILRDDIPARLIELQSICTYTNPTNQDISRFYHRVTVPPSLDCYQILTDIEGENLDNATMHPHKNDIDHFLTFDLIIPAHSSIKQSVRFKILLLPVDYLKVNPVIDKFELKKENIYTHPSRYIESDTEPIKKIAQQFEQQSNGNVLSQMKFAYEFPAKHLKFKPQDPIGALAALESKQGDCTEYSAICIALCRAQGIPARQTGVFHIRKKKEIFQRPNHNAVEAFWGDLGWVPLDPNLGQGKYDGEYGFGRTGNSVILLKREGAWVWSNYLPQSSYDATKPKPSVKPKMAWTTKVLDEGHAKTLVEKYYPEMD